MPKQPETQKNKNPDEPEIAFASEEDVAQFVFECCLMEAHLFNIYLKQDPIQNILDKQASLISYISDDEKNE